MGTRRVSLASTNLQRELLDALPKTPRWCELRGTLLFGNCEISGFRQHPELCAVVREPDEFGEPCVYIVGRPDPKSIRAAVARNDRRGLVIATPDDSSYVMAAIPDWRSSTATLYTLPDDAPARSMEPGDRVLPLEPDHLTLIKDIPDDLRRWLEFAVNHGELCAASWEDGMPVSFCCSAQPAERCWDVSIDTLPGYQRRGHAFRVSAYMIQAMQERGREPVWGADEDNVASHALARKLGFRPVDSLILFHAPT
jgi:GNAT superfamily N-acetyltransferase